MFRFHKNHGVNVKLLCDRQVARRSNSFANAITFSQTELQPGEIFMVEIEEQEFGWSGHLRCGLTQHRPSCMVPIRVGSTMYDGVPQLVEFSADSHQAQEEKYIPIPQYSMPDLTNLGKAWIFAVTKYPNTKSQGSNNDNSVETEPFIERCGNVVRIGRNILPLHFLVSTELIPDIEDCISNDEGIPHQHGQKIYATSVGSRIGVTYEIRDCKETDEKECYMHLLINGEDLGATRMDGAEIDQPFYATVDVYGTSKQVRIVQVNHLPSLQESCRVAIRTQIPDREINGLPLPPRLKRYLRYEKP